MNKFNLTFSGEILAGENPEQVKLRFAKMFGIDDRNRLERFFSGETIILRRNLERKDAAQHYHQLQLIGAAGALVKVTASDLADDIVNTAPKAAAKPAAPAPSQRTDAAAEIKARKLALQRLAAEKQAREKAQEEARRRRLEEQAAREQAEAEAALRREEEERARQAAEQARLAAEKAALLEAKRAEEKRIQDEEAARKKALRDEAKRKAEEAAAARKARRLREKAEKAQRKAEEAARRKAELEERKRKAAEEEARRQAELAEQKRLAAAEEARLRAEREEKERRAAEEEARRKAEREEALRLAAEEEARQRAALAQRKRLEEEAEARRKAEQEKRKRLAAEKKARQKAALQEKRRLAAEQEARRLAQLEEQKRLAAEEAARKAAAQAQKAAILQAELEEQARAAAEQAAQVGAEAQRLAAEAQRKAAESQRYTADNGAKPEEELAPSPALNPGIQSPRKSAKGRVKTTLDVPLRERGHTPRIGTPGQHRRQSGAPNLYKLRPFRNSQEVQARATHAHQRMRRSYALGAFALALLLIAGGGFLQNGAYPVVAGASAVAISPQSGPLLLAGDTLLLHDRAGVATTDVTLRALGVTTLLPPLLFTDRDTLIAPGQLRDSASSPAGGDALDLLRCDLVLATCERLSPALAGNGIEALVANPLDGGLLLADSSAGSLLKTDRDGAVVASTAAALSPKPVLRLHGGLLWMNSAEGPAISVLRYEDSAFGQQLDEILLLPPTNLPLETARVSDFTWSGNAWWVLLHDPLSGASELHRFDGDWSHLGRVPLATDTGPLQLIRWGEKTLVNDPEHPVIQRFNAAGTAEAPFVSSQLQALIDVQHRHARLAGLAWNGGLLLCALAAILCLGLGYLHWLRTLVYRPRREQGAEPLDDHAASVRWIEPVQNRQLQLRRTGTYYGLGVLATLLLAVAMSISVWQMAALLLVFSGPAIALLLLSRQPVGHIGVVGDRLLLVDHSGQYHLAGGPRLHYRGPFLSIDDIVVFAGNRLLPAFSPAPLQRHISPPALGGIKVDHRTIAIKLLECRHPLALGAVAIAAAAAAAALLLVLQKMV